MAKMKKTLADAIAKKSNKKALKAAQGPSLAPKGYKPDTAGRAAVNKTLKEGLYSKVMGQYVPVTAKEAATIVSNMRSTSKNPSFEGAVKLSENIVSKSGKKANTPKLIKKAAKPKNPSSGRGRRGGSGLRGTVGQIENR